MQNTQPIVQTIGLTKVFKDFWHREKVRAVDDLNLELRQGEVFGLLGPNGSGKSTTVKLLLGLLFPTKGRVTLLGKPPRSIEVKKRIGYLPEETYLYPYLNAEETLDFYGRIFEIPRHERRKRTEALIRMVGLAGARKRRLGEYSKGMARRIGIAQALVGDPELVLLDEPTTGLDPIGTDEIKTLILELKNRGKTVLLCSHLLADVEDVCDRVAILYGGRIRTIGHIDDLLAQESITQLRVPDMSEETVAAVREIIREREGDKPVEVGHPRDRLENFFLRVIQQAHKEGPTLSGAQFGEVTADLYDSAMSRDTKGPELIDQLMAAPAAPDKPPEPVPGSAEAADGSGAELIDRLEHGPESRAEAEAEDEPVPEPEPRQDKGKKTQQVLGRLMGDEQNEGDDA